MFFIHHVWIKSINGTENSFLQQLSMVNTLDSYISKRPKTDANQNVGDPTDDICVKARDSHTSHASHHREKSVKSTGLQNPQSMPDKVLQKENTQQKPREVGGKDKRCMFF